MAPMLVTNTLREQIRRLNKINRSIYRKHHINTEVHIRENIKDIITTILQGNIYDQSQFVFDEESIEKICRAIVIVFVEHTAETVSLLDKLRQICTISKHSVNKIITSATSTMNADTIIFYLDYLKTSGCTKISAHAYKSICQRTWPDFGQRIYDQVLVQQIVQVLWEHSYVPPENIFVHLLDQYVTIDLFEYFTKLATPDSCFVSTLKPRSIDAIFDEITRPIHANHCFERNSSLIHCLCQAGLVPSETLMTRFACKYIERYALINKSVSDMIRIIISYRPSIADPFVKAKIIIDRLMCTNYPSGFMQHYPEYVLLGIDDDFSMLIGSVRKYGIQCCPIVWELFDPYNILVLGFHNLPRVVKFLSRVLVPITDDEKLIM